MGTIRIPTCGETGATKKICPAKQVHFYSTPTTDGKMESNDMNPPFSTNTLYRWILKQKECLLFSVTM